MSLFKVLFVMVLPPMLYPLFEYVWTAKNVIPGEYLKASHSEAALRLGTLSGIPLTLSIISVMVIRMFSSAHNTISGAESGLLKMNKSVLQNTLEQTVFFVINLWAVASWNTVPVETLILITGVFIGGRLLFWFGYTLQWLIDFKRLRSAAFILSMMNTMILLGVNARNLYFLLIK